MWRPCAADRGQAGELGALMAYRTSADAAAAPAAMAEAALSAFKMAEHGSQLPCSTHMCSLLAYLKTGPLQLLWAEALWQWRSCASSMI